jgi:hypothetical protein
MNTHHDTEGRGGYEEDDVYQDHEDEDIRRRMAPSKVLVRRLFFAGRVEDEACFDVVLQRPFRGSYLLISTPDNIDILSLLAGPLEILGAFPTEPADAKLFWYDESRDDVGLLERARIEMPACSPGTRMRLRVRLRSPGPPVEFRAAIFGKEIEG